MNGETTQVLLAVEAEAYVEALEQFDVKDVGSPRSVSMEIMSTTT